MAPANVTIQQVSAPSDQLKEDVIRMMTDLSIDDPGLLALVGNDPSLISVLTSTWVNDGVTNGELWTATEDGELVGFMMWTPPGATAKVSIAQRMEMQQPLLGALSPEGLQYYKRTYNNEFPKFVTQSIAPAAFTDVWWLRTAMVRADRQRRGIARALLEPVRQKASGLGQNIACSTTRTRNVAVYEGLGFQSRGTREMVSPWYTWSLTVFLLPSQRA